MKYDALKLENQLCFPLYAAAKEVVKKYTPVLSELDLTYTQYIALMVLWEEKTVSVKTLGERLFLDSGTLTPVLKSLEKKGYISRARLETDERVVCATLTAAGDALKDKALRAPAAVAGCLPLNADEAATLYRLLYKILGKEN